MEYKHPESLKKEVRESLMQEPHKSALIQIMEREGQLTEENVATYINNYLSTNSFLKYGFCLDCKNDRHNTCFGTCMCECRDN